MLNGPQEGKKFDQNKLRYDLLPWDAIAELTKILMFGAHKYGERNWEKGIRFSRLFSATLRHLLAWWKREENDPETGLSHLAHATVNLLFLLTYQLEKTPNLDDRKE